MLDWVEILKRILHLYKVSTQQELGMALGVPVHVGMDEERRNLVIPWPILELVVHDKGVSWDWLLTGKEKGDVRRDGVEASSEEKDGQGQRTGTPMPASGVLPPSAPPRFETRQLARSLLGGQGEPGESGNDNHPGDEGKALRQELRRLRDAMRRDLEEADRILDENREEHREQ